MYTIRDSLNSARLEPPVLLGSGGADVFATLWKSLTEIRDDVRKMQLTADETYPWLRGW